ncbi:MAG: DUF1810 domain-containing protein [Bacteroidia bacterium]|jgi:uncharacterized protein (DUF1810 family)
MEDTFKLTRFLDAQNQVYLKALGEIQQGQKQSHWMWFIFPQLKGLETSDAANYYGIRNLAEAKAYLQHPVLGKHLRQITTALLALEGKTAFEVFGSPDDMKLRSCMTLFSLAQDTEDIFQQVLDTYFGGEPDSKTISLLRM